MAFAVIALYARADFRSSSFRDKRLTVAALVICFFVEGKSYEFFKDRANFKFQRKLAIFSNLEWSFCYDIIDTEIES